MSPPATERTERLLKITASIADAVTAEQVFEALVNRVAEAVGALTAALWLVDDDGGTMTLARAHGYHDLARQQLETVQLEMAPSIPVLDAIRQREPLWIPSKEQLLDRYPHLRSVSVAEASYCVACLPLLAHGRVLGVLGITMGQTRELSTEERELLQLVSRYASQAVERLRLLDAERRSRAVASAAAQRLGMLNRASRAFGDSELQLELRLQAIVGELATAMRSWIHIDVLRPDGLLHITTTQHPIPEAQELLRALARQAPVRMGEGISGAATSKSLILPCMSPELTAKHAVPAHDEFLRRFPIYALLAVALKVRGRVIGTVTASRVREGETYTTDDLQLLEELAQRAAVAIDNSLLHRQTVEARVRAEQLYRFAQAVVAADRIEIVYEAALGSIEAALGTTRAAILTFDHDGSMRFKAARGLSDAYRAAVEGHSPWPRDAVSPQPVLVADVANDPSMATYLPVLRAEGIAALAFVPLVNRGRLLGKFMVYYDQPQPHPFLSDHVETAGAIANHLASVMTRFALIAELEDTIRSNELFAGVLAHDLRNPLAAIMTAAQLILMQREGAAATPVLEARPASRILASGQRMTAMIDQLLDFTRARSGGGIAVEPHSTDLSELCKQAVSELELSHPEWKIQRELTGDPRGTWDSHRLVQVLSNLVANAGQHGSSAISVTLDCAQRDHVRIAIHNDGAVPPALLPEIFDPFRTTRHRHDQSRGLGLGLFIVREIVRAHHGTVDVVSSDEAGTTFTIQLPRHTMLPPA